MKFTALVLLTLSINSYADGILLSTGRSTTIDKNNVNKIAYIYEVDKPWAFISDNNLFLEWEASYFVWENKYDVILDGEDITGVALTPVFGYRIPYKNNNFYVRAGIGVAYIGTKKWGNRELGDNWTFEDKLEVGYSFDDQHNLGFSLTHYSNAKTNKHNDGVNLLSLNYSYKWQ